MSWLYIMLTALLAGAASAALTLWLARRALLRARLLTERAHVRSHLLELANLTGGLAHEIKNPLSTININLKLLAEDLAGKDEPQGRRNSARLARLLDEVTRLNDILDDFLKYAGQQELNPAPTDLRQLMAELIDFFRPQAEAHRVLLRGDTGSAPVTCVIDERLIKQALLNLILNATQAMTEGGELILRLSTNDGQALVEIIDTGPGIPPEVLPRIFEAYYSKRPGGTGLGLPTARRIVRQHEGDLRVQTEVGKGSRFMLSLPLA